MPRFEIGESLRIEGIPDVTAEEMADLLSLLEELPKEVDDIVIRGYMRLKRSDFVPENGLLAAHYNPKRKEVVVYDEELHTLSWSIDGNELIPLLPLAGGRLFAFGLFGEEEMVPGLRLLSLIVLDMA